MSVQGSTIATVKKALVDTIATRVDATNVVISYNAPRKATDLRNDVGDYEAIWLGDADGDENVPVFHSTPLWWDETYEFDVLIQVLRRGSEAEQSEADERACELLGIVLGALAQDPTLGAAMTPIPSDFRRLEVVPARWRHVTGRLDPNGFGSRFELRLSVEGRVAIT